MAWKMWLPSRVLSMHSAPATLARCVPGRSGKDPAHAIVDPPDHRDRHLAGARLAAYAAYHDRAVMGSDRRHPNGNWSAAAARVNGIRRLCAHAGHERHDLGPGHQRSHDIGRNHPTHPRIPSRRTSPPSAFLWTRLCDDLPPPAGTRDLSGCPAIDIFALNRQSLPLATLVM